MPSWLTSVYWQLVSRSVFVSSRHMNLSENMLMNPLFVYSMPEIFIQNFESVMLRWIVDGINKYNLTFVGRNAC